MEKLIANQSVIISLDVDTMLFERLHQLADLGLSVVELNTADVALLKAVLHAFPQLYIGAGNIITTQMLEACHHAGVHFMTSPGFLLGIAQTAQVYNIHYIPGIATPSEAMQAISMGYHYVRPYPATLAFCTLLNTCFPSLRLLPADIETDDMEHFLSLPTVAAVGLRNPHEHACQRVARLSTPA